MKPRPRKLRRRWRFLEMMHRYRKAGLTEHAAAVLVVQEWGHAMEGTCDESLIKYLERHYRRERHNLGRPPFYELESAMERFARQWQEAAKPLAAALATADKGLAAAARRVSVAMVRRKPPGA